MTSIKIEDLKPGTSLAMFTYNWKFLSRYLQVIIIPFLIFTIKGNWNPSSRLDESINSEILINEKFQCYKQYNHIDMQGLIKSEFI